MDKPIANREWLKRLKQQLTTEHRLETPENLLEVLSNLGILNPVELRNHLMMQDYYIFLHNNHGHHYNVYYQLSDKYQLSERQVQNVVYRELRRRLRKSTY